jgi:hypothetical protein
MLLVSLFVAAVLNLNADPETTWPSETVDVRLAWLPEHNMTRTRQQVGRLLRLSAADHPDGLPDDAGRIARTNISPPYSHLRKTLWDLKQQ